MGGGISGSNFYPTWGNEFLPLEPREAMEQGDMERVDVLMGKIYNTILHCIIHTRLLVLRILVSLHVIANVIARIPLCVLFRYKSE